MRVVYDYEIFSRQKYGGISRYFYELINRLASSGQIDIEMFLGINNTSYKFNNTGKHFRKTEYRSMAAHKIHLALQPLNKMWFKKFSGQNRFDLIHKTYYSNCGLNTGCPVISTFHDMTHELMPQFFAKADNTSVNKRITANSSDGLICVSETTKKDLLDTFGINREKVRVIYHGITLKRNESSERVIQPSYILYVGQRWGYKNFDVLMKAFSRSDWLKGSFKLVCFGGGSPNLSEKLYINENRLNESIIFLRGDDELLVSLYRYAEALVYTSFYEGFGFPPLEAMECGCPVLTSPAGSVKEIAVEAAVYFDPASAEDLTDKLRMIIGDSELRKRLIINGRKRILDFSWDVCAAKHLEFYKEISKN